MIGFLSGSSTVALHRIIQVYIYLSKDRDLHMALCSQYMGNLNIGITSSPGWAQEDKWTFLLAGDKVGVPITPFNKTDDAIVVKHKSIEGGMGIKFYKVHMH